jgi:hypothetical protein
VHHDLAEEGVFLPLLREQLERGLPGRLRRATSLSPSRSMLIFKLGLSAQVPLSA